MRKGDVRKAAIIDAAEQLFYTRGYENTSVQDVLDVLHLSKGGFYHHFESKLSLLEAICERRIEKSYEACVEKLRENNLKSVEKLNTVFSLCTYFGQDSLQFKQIMLSVAYRDKASMLREQSRMSSIRLMRSLVDEILGNGQKNGEFTLRYPEVTGEIILNLCFNLADEVSFLMTDNSDVVRCAAEIQLHQNAYSDACETLLSAAKGTVIMLDTKAAGDLLVAYNSMNN